MPLPSRRRQPCIENYVIDVLFCCFCRSTSVQRTQQTRPEPTVRPPSAPFRSDPTRPDPDAAARHYAAARTIARETGIAIGRLRMNAAQQSRVLGRILREVLPETMRSGAARDAFIATFWRGIADARTAVRQ